MITSVHCKSASLVATVVTVIIGAVLGVWLRSLILIPRFLPTWLGLALIAAVICYVFRIYYLSCRRSCS